MKYYLSVFGGVFCFFLMGGIHAQNVIYLDKELKNGKVLEITAEKIKYANPLNPGPVYSVSPSKTVLLFNDAGEFLVPSSLDFTNANATNALVSNFIGATKTNGTHDKIYTLQKKVLECEIVKEDDNSLFILLNNIDLKIEKATVAIVIYKNGTHKLMADAVTTAEILSDFMSAKINSAATAKNVKPVNTTVNTAPQPAANTAPPPSSPAKKDSTSIKKAIQPEPKNESKAAVSIRSMVTLLVYSNKGSAVYVKMNDSLVGNIPAGVSKKLMLDTGSYYFEMDDKKGNVVIQNVVISTSDLSKNFSVKFPEIDYAAIKLSELKRKADISDSIALAKKNKLKGAAMFLAAQKKERIDTYKARKESLFRRLEEQITSKNKLERSMDSICQGQLPFDHVFIANYQQFADQRTGYEELKKSFMDSMNFILPKEAVLAYLKKTGELENQLKNRVGDYIQAVQGKKKPVSANLQVALSSGRSADLAFFIPADSVNEKIVNNEYPLVYAINQNLTKEIVECLISAGADMNYFGRRFPNSDNIYKTPLMVACIKGNESVVTALAKASAHFYPENTSPKEIRNHMKYLMSHLNNKNIAGILQQSGYDLNDGTEERKAAIKDILENMVLVHNGTFKMGCTEDQSNDCVDAERPAIDVTINSFYLSRVELTRKNWLAIMEEDDPGEFKDCKECPVERITYDTTIAFIKKLNALTGKSFRLPTEAEWEYAARGGNKATRLYKFSGSDDFSEVSNCKDNSTGRPKPPGQKKANELGLFDMSGNVAEWCSDWYTEKYYVVSSKNNPVGPSEGFQKVIRGGAWNLTSWSSRVSRRLGLDRITINNGIGFRLALNAD